MVCPASFRTMAWERIWPTWTLSDCSKLHKKYNCVRQTSTLRSWRSYFASIFIFIHFTNVHLSINLLEVGTSRATFFQSLSLSLLICVDLIPHSTSLPYRVGTRAPRWLARRAFLKTFWLPVMAWWAPFTWLPAFALLSMSPSYAPSLANISRCRNYITFFTFRMGCTVYLQPCRTILWNSVILVKISQWMTVDTNFFTIHLHYYTMGR